MWGLAIFFYQKGIAYPSEMMTTSSTRRDLIEYAFIALQIAINATEGHTLRCYTSERVTLRVFIYVLLVLQLSELILLTQ